MTYKEIAAQIESMTEDQKNSDASIFIRGIDEFYPAYSIEISREKDNSVLDDDHPFIVV